MLQSEENKNDVRLIEAGFPCHQVGAETQRERDTGKAPPTHRLHVWWARRPLTPSRAAILASLLPAGTDPDWFLRQLGIEKVEALVNGVPWILDKELIDKIEKDLNGQEEIVVDPTVLRFWYREIECRRENSTLITKLKEKNEWLARDPVLERWDQENRALLACELEEGQRLQIIRRAADPYWAKQRIEWENSNALRTKEDKYGYNRAFTNGPIGLLPGVKQLTILDPTAGGGSVPFEGLRLGHKVIANDINPVASIILYATLDYPLRFGPGLAEDIRHWGERLRGAMVKDMSNLFPESFIPEQELHELRKHLRCCPTKLLDEFNKEELDGFLYARQVTCPHCGGEAPLLNTCWLSKTGEKWGVRIVPDGRPRGGKVQFETYRIKGRRGPNGEDPNFATVMRAVGTCVHCRQAISAEEIKAQARGESPHGRWQDRLYAVVALRYQPQLDKNGQPQRYKSGPRAGQIKTNKVRFFRPPNQRDLEALAMAEQRLQERWPKWEQDGLIPTENIPRGHKTLEPLRAGMTRWCDLFTPRQLLGHLTLVEELNRLKPRIVAELGEDRGRAVVTYLQFAIDKGLDYNSKQTRWHYSRGVLINTFGRHDFSLKWTFGEMIFTGPNSGAAWGLSQVLDAYQGIAELVAPLHEKITASASPLPVRILCSTAAHMDVPDASVDLICIDPPYYNNVQYAELSDYFYIWQKRTLQDLYPAIFRRRLTNKTDEAVANPARDGSTAKAAKEYERQMGEIFAECRRVLKDDGLMTIMFTHKTQEAWETIARSLIESGWTITSSSPVESEAAHSMHQKDMAAAASSIFLTCRKRPAQDTARTAIWTGFGSSGVAHQVRAAVGQGLREFERLNLNPVDEMVASYGRALRVLSENWPVLDGDELVSPLRAMNEASAVVAQHHITRLTQGRLLAEDLNPEAAMALTLYGIFGLSWFPYDEALNLSRSLNIKLVSSAGGYKVEGQIIGINNEQLGRSGRPSDTADEAGFYAPLVSKGSRLRLARPEERHPVRLQEPQTEWDLLHGLLLAYRQGDVPVARAYLVQQAAGREQVVRDLLAVWTAQMADEKLRREGETILFGLR